MDLSAILTSQRPPKPWADGDNIPWNEPGFSKRMLQEHLSQQHDHASRRATYIEGHVGWIHSDLLGGKPARVLDLGCGPGLYSCSLARLGHQVTGIDFSPASMEYATKAAQREGLPAEHVLGDLRTTPFGEGYDLAMQIFGEINVFRPADAELILRKAHAALKPGGTLLLEVSSEAQVRGYASEGRDWWPSANGGLFSERPHVGLSESFWDEESKAVTHRYFLIDVATGQVERMATSQQAYSDEEYVALLTRCGFKNIRMLEHLGGAPKLEDFLVILAERA